VLCVVSVKVMGSKTNMFTGSQNQQTPGGSTSDTGTLAPSKSGDSADKGTAEKESTDKGATETGSAEKGSDTAPPTGGSTESAPKTDGTESSK
jgi:hypothetical protein